MEPASIGRGDGEIVLRNGFAIQLQHCVNEPNTAVLGIGSYTKHISIITVSDAKRKKSISTRVLINRCYQLHSVSRFCTLGDFNAVFSRHKDRRIIIGIHDSYVNKSWLRSLFRSYTAITNHNCQVI